MGADWQVVRDISTGIDRSDRGPEALLCLPATLLSDASREVAGTSLTTGGQTCHAVEKGAYTGDISAPMLKEAGAAYVIVGHSERRTAHGETDSIVAAQAAAALAAGLKPIICVGETLDQRNSGETLPVIEAQIEGSLAGLPSNSGVVVAYEPLWAIGTGRVATPEQISEVHDFVPGAYTHLTLPTNREGEISVGSGTLKNKKTRRVSKVMNQYNH